MLEHALPRSTLYEYNFVHIFHLLETERHLKFVLLLPQHTYMYRKFALFSSRLSLYKHCFLSPPKKALWSICTAGNAY